MAAAPFAGGGGHESLDATIPSPHTLGVAPPTVGLRPNGLSNCGVSRLGDNLELFDLADGSSRTCDVGLDANLVQWSADGSRIAVASDDVAVAFAPDTGAASAVVGFLSNAFPGVGALAASPSGRLLVVEGSPLSLVVDTTTWEVRQVLEHGPEYDGDHAFSPDERFLACTWQQELFVYELSTGRMVFRCDFGRSTPLAWDSSSTRLIVFEEGGKAEVVNFAHDVWIPVGGEGARFTWAAFVPAR